jgi:hypothetical protein
LKDIVFVKLAEFVEETRGLAVWDELLQEVDADSRGIYTFVGLFDDQELFLFESEKTLRFHYISLVNFATFAKP